MHSICLRGYENLYLERKMGKRKLDGCINDLIAEYLKKRKCEKTLKLFEEKNMVSENRNLCEQFRTFLMKKESEKENRNDDLGFEINFGAFQSVAKVSFQLFPLEILYWV